VLKEVAFPPKIMPSSYGPPLPDRRAAELPGIVSLKIGDLFPDITPAIYLQEENLSIIRTAAVKALEDVDMNMIKAEDTVNILCS
jgi:hypothetical protein